MSSRTERKTYRGTHVSVVESRAKLGQPPAGHFGRVTPPSEDAVRVALEAGRCPFCGRGPFAVVALHVHQRHGVDKLELRAMAGLVKRASICSPEYAAGARERVAQRGGVRTTWTPRRGLALSVSEPGRAALRKNGERVKGRKASDAQRAAGLRNGRLRGEQLKKERRLCVVCGTRVPFEPGNAKKKTCGLECRTERRRQATREARAARPARKSVT